MQTKLNLSLITAGVALALSGAAHATLEAVVDSTIFMSGASAPSNMLRENVVRNTCDASAAINVYVDTVKGSTGVATALPLLEHTTHWVVQCTAAAGTGTNLAGKKIAVYKSDAGGSGNGTTPVSEMVAVPFMNADTTNCAFSTAKAIQNGGGATYNLYTCGTDDLVNQIPDGGTSDIEPNKFTGSLAPTSGSYADRGNLNVQSGPGLIFSPAVTLAFRNELQNDQVAKDLLAATCTDGGLTDADRETEDCMPSIPGTMLRTLTQGKLQLWATEEIYGSTVNVPSTFAGADGILGTGDDVTPSGSNATLKNFVHLCRRTQGSGTHAEWMIHHHRTNCASSTDPMPTQPGLTGGKPAVFENSSSGNLGLCLDNLDQGTAYTGMTPPSAAGRASFAIGYQATEKNQGNGENWRFVKTDGMAPTRENVFNGDYDQVYYLSFQNRTTAYLPSGQDAVYESGPLRTNDSTADATLKPEVDDFYANNLNIDQAVANDINQGFLFTWGPAGFVIPSSTAPAVYDVNDPRIPWERETSANVPDSCQPLSRR